MKKKLLLYLSHSSLHWNVHVAATMAWLSRSKGYIFDNYYDSYHQGIHFPGGDSRNLDEGLLTGGTVCGDRHFEELYFLLSSFDVSVIMCGDSIFNSVIRNINVPVISSGEEIKEIYQKLFAFFDAPFSEDVVITGTNFGNALMGVEAYFYPEIYYRQAIGIPDSLPEEDLDEICSEKKKIYCFFTDEGVINRLSEKGYDLEIVDSLHKDDDYLTITGRIADRWKEKGKGWILGDPLLVSYWLPKACEDDLLSLYSVPQEKIVSQMGELISSKGKVVYGRQYSDRDFFELSKLNQCLQVIDPCRPPFQSLRHIDYSWQSNNSENGFYDEEYSDEELKRFAREGRVIVSLLFWSGMIREVANFYNLMDLFAMTRLRCGLVVTAQNFEYTMRAPFEMLTLPLERGGVFPLVEPVLGSCGIGVGIESLMDDSRVCDDLKEAMSRIREKVNHEKLMPRGLWVTMDTDLEKLEGHERPKPVRLMKYAPYVQFRFHMQDRTFEDIEGISDGNASRSLVESSIDRLKRGIEKAGLKKYFEPYRPYEFYRAGAMKKGIVDAAKDAGLEYMFTKSAFKKLPAARYIDDNFVAMNYTAGQWDGWTPFETVNDVSDLEKSEKEILKSDKPGWIVSTIDSCLWTFSGEFWKRGSRLFEIASFCTQGGRSGRLVNVKPHTVARYSRIIEEMRA